MSKKILLIEDEPIVALQLKEILSSNGFSPIGPVKSILDALSLLDAHDISLILSDQNLGPELGSDIVTQILEHIDVPAVFLTAYSDPETLQRIKSVSPFGYIQKPVKEAALVTTIEVALEQFSTGQDLKIQFGNLQLILDAIQVGAILIDLDGVVKYLNASAMQYVGDGEAGGMHWTDLFDIEAREMGELKAIIEGQSEPRVVHVCHQGTSHLDVYVSYSEDDRHKIITLTNKTELAQLRERVEARSSQYGMIGQSQSMQDLFTRIDHFALTDVRVFISGETGTGKELVARAIHEQSQRKDQPFVVVNCAAFSKELVASALFGHKKGAFTGAQSDHKGFFELASGGTLFLDEIGDIDPTTQIQLLRVLESGEITRVGDNRSIKVDVRVLTATHRNLKEMIEAGAFRQDLYYRIHVARLDIPALRDRKTDIRLLANHFLKHPGNLYVTEISEPALQALIDYNWPGNVRELRNVIESSSILPMGSSLLLEHLPAGLVEPGERLLDTTTLEKGAILQALKDAGFKKAEAARILGIGRTTLYRKMQEFGIQ